MAKVADAVLTVVQAREPKVLTKRVYLAEDGTIQKTPSAQLTSGRAIRHRVTSLLELSKLLISLSPNEAITYGVTIQPNIELITQSNWLKQGKPAEPIPRTNEHFSWHDGPGVMMLDYDVDEGEQETMDRAGLVQALQRAAPGLENVALLWWPSSSSHIFLEGKDVTGLRGQRLYMLVRNASDIPRAGNALSERLWLAGFGRYKVSKSGCLLSRTLVDTLVWQPNRLDFASGASCSPPLEQRRGSPVLVEGAEELVDTAAAIPSLSARERTDLQRLQIQKRNQVASQAAAHRNTYIATEAQRLAGNDAAPDALERATDTIRKALDHTILQGHFELSVCTNEGLQRVTVDEVISKVGVYDRLLTLDPIEPEYDGGREVGILYLQQPNPVLFSYAHGGSTYRLAAGQRVIVLQSGRTHQAVEEALAVMRDHPSAFDFGDQLALVDQGDIHLLDDPHLRQWLPSVVRCLKQERRDGVLGHASIDPPQNLCKQILALKTRRRLKKLKAVATIPTLRPDGTVLQTPGFDETTGLFLDLQDYSSHVPSSPTIDECQAALTVLMTPYREFPFVSELDRAVLLAAILTAVVRPSLPTAPAFAFDAPSQGAGKTLLAKTIGALAKRSGAAVWPHTGGRDDEETRKRVVTALRNGDLVVIWDNVVGVFRSAALAAVLTAQDVSDRILGKSESTTLPNKALFLITGNNLHLADDLPRRVLVCRVDPEVARPYARQFELDPLEYVQRHRLAMAVAALTLMRGSLCRESIIDLAPGRTASFEQWDRFVRQTVVFVHTYVARGEFGDVMEKFDENDAIDPEKEALGDMLAAWWSLFSEQKVCTKTVVSAINTTRGFGELCGVTGDAETDAKASELRESLLAMGVDTSSPKSLGRILSYRVDRNVHGYRLRRFRDRSKNTSEWRVERVASE